MRSQCQKASVYQGRCRKSVFPNQFLNRTDDIRYIERIPGPGLRNIPSGLSASISAAVAWQGYTVTVQSFLARLTKMFFLRPQSSKDTLCPMTIDIRLISRYSFNLIPMKLFRQFLLNYFSSVSALTIIAFMTPYFRTARVTARVSTL